jgi:tetratricopeptide (TPR) repeat protein
VTSKQNPYEEQLRNAIALWKNNQGSEASKATAALIQSNPNRWEGYGLAGAIEKAQNKLSEAKAAYQRALSLAPDDAKPQIMAAMQQIDSQPIGNLKTQDKGPSLEVTMKFIQDKLNDVGPMNFAVYVHADGKGYLVQHKVALSNVVADAETCHINYRKEEVQPGALTSLNENSFYLVQVADIQVMTYDQEVKEIDTSKGHTDWTERADPALFVMKVNRKDKAVNRFFFYSEDLANRVAKAMTHAVELCGGGDETEPF